MPRYSHPSTRHTLHTAPAGDRGVSGPAGRRCCLWLAIFLLLTAALVRPALADDIYIDLDDRFIDMRIERDADGNAMIAVDSSESSYRLTPEEFVDVIDREQEELRAKGLLFTLFNITTWWGVLWVSVGILGQLLFTFRMVLQWLASEKQHRSVVPVGFWWGSLIGGLMLLTYFIWRKDIVGTLGQSTGAIIYIRNLWLIYYGQRLEAPTGHPLK